MCVCVCLCMCACTQSPSHVWLFVTPWTVACQAPLSIAFPRQEYWSGLPFCPPGDLSNPGVKAIYPVSPALAGRFFATMPRYLTANFGKSLYSSPVIIFLESGSSETGWTICTILRVVLGQNFLLLKLHPLLEYVYIYSEAGIPEIPFQGMHGVCVCVWCGVCAVCVCDAHSFVTHFMKLFLDLGWGPRLFLREGRWAVWMWTGWVTLSECLLSLCSLHIDGNGLMRHDPDSSPGQHSRAFGLSRADIFILRWSHWGWLLVSGTSLRAKS